MYSLISYFVQLAGLNLSSCVLLGWLASVIKKLKVSQILSWTLACIFQRNILGLLVKYKVRSESMLLISYKHQSRSRSFECNQKKKSYVLSSVFTYMYKQKIHCFSFLFISCNTYFSSSESRESEQSLAVIRSL